MSARRNPEDGFWQLWHDDLAALLARRDLSWETARVYLALADLTRGYGRDRDIVSLSQIADLAGIFIVAADGAKRRDIRHVRRALKTLAALGLCGQAPTEGQDVTRWVTWPPPPLEAPSTTASLGSSASPGSSATADATANATADAGRGTTASPGRHQDVEEIQDAQEGEKARPPTADNGGRLLSLSFPDGATGKQTKALNASLRQARQAGVPDPWLAHALVSRKTDGPPWKRIDHAIGTAKSIVQEIRKAGRLKPTDLRHLVDLAEREGIEALPARIGGWPAKAVLRQATEWPESGKEQTP